jgi:outer membrane protein insertion porin family/translocation and assembly module TamA
MFCAAGAADRLAAQDTLPIVRSLKFVGNQAIDDYTLSIAIGTTNSSWFARAAGIRWLGLGEKRYYDPVEFRRDVLRLTLLYRQSGFMEVQVDTLVERKGRNVSLTFRIIEGPPIVVTSLRVTGLDSVPHGAELARRLPLATGEPFNRFLLQASADSLQSRLRNQGYPAVEVFRNFGADRRARTAEISLDVVPGPRSRIGPIRVTGAARVDSSFIRQLLVLHAGQRYTERDLFESQRKLYQTELFRLATVSIDSAHYDPESAVVPLAVQVAEGKFHRLRSGLGFATNDCFRGGAGWTDRNLLSSGRLFDISGRVSKVGVGWPHWGLERSICSGLKDDPIGSSVLNYNLTALVRQPRFFSPNLTGTYSVFTERRSEFAVYRRDEIGISFGLLRETSRRVPITLGYRLTYGNTTANAASFCAFFNACTVDDTRRLREKRLFGIVSAGVAWPRQDNPLDPGRGHSYNLDVSHSSRVTGSARLQTFSRFSGDLAWYVSLGNSGSVLSAHLRGGLIFAPRVSLDTASGSFIPPEQRFYAGGPNDVRGYDRNELGPVVYVVNADPAGDSTTLAKVDQGLLRPRFSATGGNTMAVAQVELRVPAPIWSRRLRLAAFIDAGTLYQRCPDILRDCAGGLGSDLPVRIRVTPGIGLRVLTPLGPARFDVGYNGYPAPSGTLYLLRQDGSLDAVRSNFRRAGVSRYRFHISFGQPF